MALQILQGDCARALDLLTAFEAGLPPAGPEVASDFAQQCERLLVAGFRASLAFRARFEAKAPESAAVEAAEKAAALQKEFADVAAVILGEPLRMRISTKSRTGSKVCLLLRAVPLDLRCAQMKPR